MSKIHKHIEIVSSTVKGLSSMNSVSRESLREILSRHYSRVGITIVNSLADLEILAARKPDLVFLGMKFLPKNLKLGFQDTERVWVSEYLDDNEVAYTGSGKLAHSLELNKPLAKQRILDHGLQTSPFIVATRTQSIRPKDIRLNYPLFVKPVDRGGGMGVDSKSVVNNFRELRAKILSMTSEIQSDALLEEYLPGREISVAVLKENASGQYLVMPLERIVPQDKYGNRVLSPAAKHADAGFSVLVNDSNLKTAVAKLAIDVFHALGARDYGRIDVRLDKYGTPKFLEANLLPSLIKNYGNFPKACVLNRQLDYESMVLSIVDLAFLRTEEAQAESPMKLSKLLPQHAA